MKRYICHKAVMAEKIRGVASSTLMLRGGAIIKVGRDWIERFRPMAGGYYVVYDDGYSSFSPQKAFEEGYTETKE